MNAVLSRLGEPKRRLILSRLYANTKPNGDPIRFFVNGTWYKILRILKHWQDAGCWWKGDSPKEYWRLELEQGRVWEVYRDLVTNEWFICKIEV